MQKGVLNLFIAFFCCVLLMGERAACEIRPFPIFLQAYVPSFLRSHAGGASTFLFVQQAGPSFVEIIPQYARIRSMPDDFSALVYLAKRGERYKVIAKEDTWLRVSVDNNKEGWISERQVKYVQAEANPKSVTSPPAATSSPGPAPSTSAAQPPPLSTAPTTTPSAPKESGSYLTVTAPYARVRQLPSQTAAFLVLVKHGERYECMERSGAWLKIKVNGKIGWVSATDVAVPDSFRPSTPSPQVQEPTPLKAAEPPVQNADTGPKSTPPAYSFDTTPTRRIATPLPLHDTVRPPFAQYPHPNPIPFPTHIPLHKPHVPAAAPETSATAAPTPPAPPQHEAVNESRQEGLYIQIKSSKPIPIRAPDSSILSMAKKGDYFPLVLAGDTWCKILYGDKEAWVKRRDVKIVESPHPDIPWQIFIIIGTVLGVVIFILVLRILLLRFNILKAGWFKTITIEKNVLIIAQKEKFVQRYLANSTSPLSKCFAELGFHVMNIRELAKVGQALVHYMPDVIMVDWEIDRKVQTSIETILASRTATANILVIFYNVFDSVSSRQSAIIPNAQFLGPRFSDREVFSLVTPLILKKDKSINIRKSVEAAALEGEITESSLLEVFQFVEIGKKTGCLLIGAKKPQGIIYFKAGMIVYANTKSETGQNAIFTILNMKEGHFSFVLDKVAPEENCNLPTLGILMEWTKRADENHGH
jgi:uncharacterized protein YgiM (DUF1202 family)